MCSALIQKSCFGINQKGIYIRAYVCVHMTHIHIDVYLLYMLMKCKYTGTWIIYAYIINTYLQCTHSGMNVNVYISWMFVSWTVIKFTHMWPRETGKFSGFDSRRGGKRGGMRRPGDRKPAVNSHSLTPEVPWIPLEANKHMQEVQKAAKKKVES
jgi:hypothetical protein